jgi:hypothetical protein
MKRYILAAMAALCINFSHASDVEGHLDFSFEWGDIPRCTNGNPNTVSNPIFTFPSIPDNAQWATFKLKDVQVPMYNHGGGRVELEGNTTIDENGNTIIDTGKFSYKSPCPPSGRHGYRWQVIFTDTEWSSNWIDQLFSPVIMYP